MYTNGRVALYNYGGMISGELLHVPTKPDGKPSSAYVDAMIGSWTDTPLSCRFFSAGNVQVLQNELREGVKKRSKGQYVIGEQNEDELKTIMRSIFLQYAENNASQVDLQVSRLNKLVLDYAIGQVYGEAQGYLKYLRDAGTLYSDGGALLPMPVAPDSNCKELEFRNRAI